MSAGKGIHRHDWRRLDFFSPELAYECKCGAACTVGRGDERSYYSPRKTVGGKFLWIQISRGMLRGT